MSRVHSQLVSQMRATFRAMEKSQQQQQQQQQQPLLQKLSSEQRPQSSQQSESKKQPSNSIENDKLGLNTKQELRALSQRLERMLREQREASNIVADNETTSTSSNAATKNNITTLAEMDHIDIPRPDPMPLDPR